MVSAKDIKDVEIRQYVNQILGELAYWVLYEFEDEQRKYGWDVSNGFAVIPMKKLTHLKSVAKTLATFQRDFLEVYWALSDAMQFADKCETALVSKDDCGDGGEGRERMCDKGNIRKEKRTALRFCLSGEVDCNDLEKLVYIQEKLNSLFIHSSVVNNREYREGNDYAKWCEGADSLAESTAENTPADD